MVGISGTYDAVIVGAGIAGCTLAYEFSKRGLKVVVLEQNVIAAESSGKNTGTLFAGPQREVVDLLDACASIYYEMAEGPIPFEFRKTGHILVSGTDVAYERSKEHAQRMREAGVGIEAFSGREIARDYPELRMNVAGGYYVDRAYSLEPLGATHSFAHAARDAGAKFITGCRVVQIHTNGGKVDGVLSDVGIIPADLVVLANGLWMNDLLRRTVGDGPLPSLPFTAGRGWLIQLGKLDFELPFMIEELSWPDQEDLGAALAIADLQDVAERKDDTGGFQAICLNPMRGGDARLGATNVAALRDLVRDTDVASSIATRAIRLVGRLATLKVLNAYLGNRPMLSDGMPVAGKSLIEGLYVHGGMGSIGMHAAPATARWLAEAIVSGKGQPDKAWLVPGRFPGWS